jgi:hypothetical protein
VEAVGDEAVGVVAHDYKKYMYFIRHIPNINKANIFLCRILPDLTCITLIMKKG